MVPGVALRPTCDKYRQVGDLDFVRIVYIRRGIQVKRESPEALKKRCKTDTGQEITYHTKVCSSLFDLLNNFVIRIITLGLVSLIQHNTNYRLGIAPPFRNVLFQRLGSTEEQPPAGPILSARRWVGPSRNFSRMSGRDSHNPVALLNLLRHEWTCWGTEYHLASWKPPIVIVHYNSCNQSFTQTGGERNKRIVHYGSFRYLLLIPADWELGILGIYPRLGCLLVQRYRPWFVLEPEWSRIARTK